MGIAIDFGERDGRARSRLISVRRERSGDFASAPSAHAENACSSSDSVRTQNKPVRTQNEAADAKGPESDVTSVRTVRPKNAEYKQKIGQAGGADRGPQNPPTVLTCDAYSAAGLTTAEVWTPFDPAA